MLLMPALKRILRKEAVVLLYVRTISPRIFIFGIGRPVRTHLPDKAGKACERVSQCNQIRQLTFEEQSMGVAK